MIKAILLDCGGVLVKPVTGDWVLGPEYETVLGDTFAARHLDRFRDARKPLVPMLPDANITHTDDEEYAMFLPYYKALFARMDFPITDAQIARLAWLQVYRDDRYALFDDVLPALTQWRAQYRLGIISDAPPSTRRAMDNAGVTALLHGATYSCEIGALKPSPAIYQRTLSLLGVAPEEAVFIDDLPGNLYGAQALGIRGIQMRRPMPPLFTPAPAWNGPIVHSFAELDALLGTL